MESETVKRYAHRDAQGQGNWYIRHIMAMTAEDLHSKSDIAAELAHRDILIDALAVQVRELNDHIAACQSILADAHINCGSDGSVTIGIERLLERVRELREENERLTGCLRVANSQTEEFERKYYLESDKVEKLEQSLATAREALSDIAEGQITRGGTPEEISALNLAIDSLNKEAVQSAMVGFSQNRARRALKPKGGEKNGR